jgi:molecular chaperone GrpE
MSDDLQEDGKPGRKGGPPPFSVIDRRPALRDDVEPLERPRHPSYVEELQARVEEAERRAREISAAYRRLEEDRDAFRERLSRDLERRVGIARGELLRKVIGILDDLDRALDAARTASAPPPLLEGVALIRDRLIQVLASEGVESLETVGRAFDPDRAEAIATEEVDDPAQDGLVIEEAGRGYTLRGTLLRPARVKVARRRQAAKPPAGGPGEPPS